MARHHRGARHRACERVRHADREGERDRAQGRLRQRRHRASRRRHRGPLERRPARRPGGSARVLPGGGTAARARPGARADEGHLRKPARHLALDARRGEGPHGRRARPALGPRDHRALRRHPRPPAGEPGHAGDAGHAIATLDDISVIKLDFTVPERYLAVLARGQDVAAKSETYPDRKFAGRVASVDSRVDPVTRSVTVRAEVPNADRLLRPGMLMSLDVILAPRQAVVVPEIAVLQVGSGRLHLPGQGRPDGRACEGRARDRGARAKSRCVRDSRAATASSPRAPSSCAMA